MKLIYLAPRNFLTNVAHALERLGHFLVSPDDYANVVLCMSVTQMAAAEKAVIANQKARLFVYNWDVYDWSLANPRPNEYDWARFKKLCMRAEEVWVPSQAEADRYRRWTGREAVIVKTAVPFWTMPEITPRDSRFVLDTLRETPDPCWGMAARACRELGIPFVASKHGQGFDKYAQLLASCTFTVSTLWEASTGGLGLVEAAWYGKRCLVPDNPENAGGEYVPGAVRYKAQDFEDLKAKIRELWEKPEIDPDCNDRAWIRTEYSAEAMASAINARL